MGALYGSFAKNQSSMKFIRLLVTVWAIVFGSTVVSADQNVYLFMREYVDEPIEPMHNGNRLPARRVMCTIGDDGVRIDGYIAEDDILSYEVWDTSGEVCVASFTDERDFINGLKLLHGDYQVRFAVADYLFIGYITL